MATALLPAVQRGLPLVVRLGQLERVLSERSALLVGQPSDIVDAVLAEERAFASGAPTREGGAPGLDDGHNALPQLRDDVIREAMFSDKFRQCASAVSLKDMSTSAGRRGAIEVGFASDSTIVLRLLHYGEHRLAKRHKVLQSLLDCRIDIGPHLGYCLTVDKLTGVVPKRAAGFSLAGPTGRETTLLTAFMKQQYLGPDYYGAVGGVYDVKALLTGAKFTPVARADFYCVPEYVQDFCDYMHTLFVATGHPNSVPGGFTMKSWSEFYIPHLRRCVMLTTYEEQLEWLRFASEQFEAFLRYAEHEVQHVLRSSDPAKATFGALMPVDGQPAEKLRERQHRLEELVNQREAWGWVAHLTARPLDPGRLPKLSAALSAPSKGRPATAADFGAQRTNAPDKRGASTQAAAPAPPKMARSGPAPPGGGGGPLPPGSQKHTFVWLDKNHILVSGRVWDVIKLAKHLGVPVDAKCWPVLLCRRLEQNKFANCPCHHLPGHKSAVDAAHVLSGFNVEALLKDFSRAPTQAEEARLAKHVSRQAAPYAANARGAPRGAPAAKPAPQRQPFRQPPRRK